MKTGWPSRAIASVFAVFFVAPTAIVVATAFTTGNIVEFPPRGFTLHWFSVVLHSPRWLESLRASAETGLLAAGIAAAAGTPLALLATRGGRSVRAAVTSIAVLPIFVPVIVIAIAFYLSYVRVHFTGSLLSLATAHAMLGIPFVFINVVAVLANLGTHIEDAARACGASWMRTLMWVTLPMIFPGVVIGAVIAFIASWDDVVVALFLTDPTFRTVQIEIFGDIQSGVQPTTSAVSSLVIAVSLMVMGLVAVGPLLRRARRRARVLEEGA